MAAAYIFYICQDHPFIDGNKRTALAAGLVFLQVNGISIMDEKGELYHAVMRIALGQMGKSEVAPILRGLADS
jgi:death-on-curing protein